VADEMRKDWLAGGRSRTYSAFVKAEKGAVSHNDLPTWVDEAYWTDEDGISSCVHPDLPDPRGISVPSAAVRYELGPYADDYNRKLMHIFSGQVLYACGLTANEIGQWFMVAITSWQWAVAVMGDDVLIVRKEGDTIWATSLDISRYDMHVRRCHLQHTFALMRALNCHYIAHQMQRLSWTRKYVIRAQHQDGKATLPGTMASGDPITISSNSTTTLTLAYYSMLTQQDPSHVFYEAGFITTGARHLALSPHWDFLQKLFYPCTDDGLDAYLPAPKIGRFAARAFWTRAQVNHSTLGYARGVCLGLQKDFAHVPIARAIVARVLELSDGVEVELDPSDVRDHEFKNFSQKACEASPATFAFVAERYSISVESIHQIEQSIAQWAWGKFLDDGNEESWASILNIDLQ